MQGTTIAGHYWGPISAVAVKMIASRKIIKVFLWYFYIGVSVIYLTFIISKLLENVTKDIRIYKKKYSNFYRNGQINVHDLCVGLWNNR